MIIQLKKETGSIVLKRDNRTIELRQIGRRGPQGIPGEPGPPAVWGDITGDIEDQADLQAALDLKADLTEIIGRDELFVNVKDHGAVGNGVTDDTVAISDALDEADSDGKWVLFPSGDYVSGDIQKSYVPRIVAEGGLVNILTTSTSGHAWEFGETTLGSSISLASDAAMNTSVLQVATTTLSADDVLYISDGDDHGQLVRVYTIDSPTQLTLAEPLYASFTVAQSAAVQLLPDQRQAVVKGLHFRSIAGPTNLAGFLRLYYCRDVDIDTQGELAGGPGVTLESCYNFRVRHVAHRYYDTAVTALPQFGYGVNISGASAHGEVNVIADQVRHAVSFNGTCNNVRVTGVAHGCTNTSFDAHQGSVNIVFDNCQVFGGLGFGFALRGKRQHVHGGSVDQAYGGVFIFDSPGDNEITGLRVSNLLDDGGSNEGNGIAANQTMSNLRIVGNSFYNIPRSAVTFRAGVFTNVDITDNIAQNVGQGGVTNEASFFRQFNGSTVDHARITKNTVIDTQTPATIQYGVQISTAGSDLVIADNSFHGVSTMFSGAGVVGVAKIGQNWNSNAVADNIVTVPFSSTPAFNAYLGNIFTLSLTGNVTSSTITNPTSGQTIRIILKQDGVGGRTFVWPTNVVWPGAAPTLATAANAANLFVLTYDVATTSWYATSQSTAYDPTAIHTTGDETATGTKTFSTKVIAGTVPDPQGANKLDVQDVMGVLMRSTNQNGPILGLYKRGTTGDDSAAVQSGAAIGTVNGYGWHGTGYTRQVDIDFSATENWSSTARGARMDGFVTSNTTTARVQVFRFDQDRSAAFYGTVKPNANLTLQLGQSNLYWTDFYARRHFFNSTAVIDGSIAGRLAITGLLMPHQAPTASAPAYVLGGMYYDTTLNKLRIGGATGWETVTST